MSYNLSFKSPGDDQGTSDNFLSFDSFEGAAGHALRIAQAVAATDLTVNVEIINVDGQFLQLVLPGLILQLDLYA